jgi:hypothetical protein
VSDLPWIHVWLQGGDADGWRYATMIEPPQTIYVVRDPFFGRHRWVRVPSSWGQDSIAYRRVPGVEQFDSERIYYPVGEDA